MSRYGSVPGAFGGAHEEWLSRVLPQDRQSFMEAVASALEEWADYQVEYQVVWLPAVAVLGGRETVT